MILVAFGVKNRLVGHKQRNSCSSYITVKKLFFPTQSGDSRTRIISVRYDVTLSFPYKV